MPRKYREYKVRIDVKNDEGLLHHLSDMQEAIWYTQKIYDSSSLYNVGGYSIYPKSIEIEKIIECLKQIICEQEMLRVCFLDIEGEPFQKISHDTASILYYEEEYELGDIDKYIQEDMKVMIDVFAKVLFSIKIFKTVEQGHVVFFKAHHLICDGYSFSILNTLLKKYYENQELEQEFQIKPVTYFDKLKQLELNDNNNYWKEKLSLKRGLAFENAIKSSNTENIETKRKEILISNDINNEIKSYCKENGLTVNSFWVSVFYFVNYIYGNNTFKLGIPSINRTKLNEMMTIGAFLSVNPLVIEEIERKDTFVDLSKKIQKEIYNMYLNSNSSLFKIRKELDLNGTSYNMLLSYQKTNYTPTLNNEKIYSKFINQGEQQEDIVVHILEEEQSNNKQITLYVDYQLSKFEDSLIDSLIKRVQSVLPEIIHERNKEKRMSEFEVSIETEKNFLLNINNTDKEFESEKTIDKLLSESFIIHNKKVALRFNGESLTYSQLDKRTNQLAKYLQSNGVVNNSLVGVVMERSFELLISIVAIIKAGGTFVPIDPLYPKDRINYMLDDAKPILLLTQSKFSDLVKEKNMFVITIDEDGKIIYSMDENYQKELNTSDSWIYMIYTSGSTGNPKGVINTHKALNNRLNWMKNQLDLDQTDIFFQKTPFSFDVSVWELILPLLIGSTLVIAEPEGHKKPSYLVETIIKEKISIIHFVPSMFGIFIEERLFPSLKNHLKKIVCSGEELSSTSVKKAKEEIGCEIINLYGPTEAAIDVSYWSTKNSTDVPRTIPIGKPIDNTTLLVMTPNQKIAPVGVSGELYIGGAGLAVGYHNRKDLTKEVFIEDVSVLGEKRRMYRTGDICKYNEDGEIIYIGRKDFQVKVNGMRIELEEIEYVLRNLDEIKNAKVIVNNTDSSSRYLITYIIFEESKTMDTTELRQVLIEKLPVHMIPSTFVSLDAFPLSANGKLDRKALSKIVPKRHSFVEPKNKDEARILELFKEILNDESIGVEDNFFEHGGTSLKAIQFISKFGAGEINDLYSFPTVRGFSHKILQVENKTSFVSLIQENNSNKAIICIPYGGGTPSIYYQFAKSINKYNVYSVNISGHSLNRKEELIDVYEMAEKVVDEIKQFDEKEIVLYGHCVGAALTHEIAKKLSESNQKVDLVVIGATYPYIKNPIKKRIGKLMMNYYYSSNERTIKFLESLDGSLGEVEEDQRVQLLNWFRHDGTQFQEYYSNVKEKFIMSRVLLLTGGSDPLTNKAKKDLLNWKNFSEKIEYHEIDNANHYFIDQETDLLIAALRKYLDL